MIRLGFEQIFNRDGANNAGNNILGNIAAARHGNKSAKHFRAHGLTALIVQADTAFEKNIRLYCCKKK